MGGRRGVETSQRRAVSEAAANCIFLRVQFVSIVILTFSAIDLCVVFSYLSWADFDASKKKGSNRPFFTYLLLLICTLVMIAAIAVNNWSFEPVDENPVR